VVGVVTDTGDRLECDFVVVGVGVEPSVELVEGSGIETDNGIVVDERCQTTAQGVYAAGDVANYLHPIFKRRLRFEHWKNAISQGQAVARAMLGCTEPYSDVPWFWSDQYDYTFQYAGLPMSGDPTVIRGRIEERRFVAFWLEGGHVVAALSLNRPRDLRWTMDLIKARVRLSPQVLEDESTDLRALLQAAGSHSGLTAQRRVERVAQYTPKVSLD
jgi:3-phenylpropionate/trans-cinnamate dioxygenase ferredoxin reductase subunit